MTKKKKAAKPLTVKELQRRIEEACGLIACVTTQPFEYIESYSNLDRAARVLQGPNYKAFVKEWTAPTQYQPEGFLWRKGDPQEEDRWYSLD